MGEQTVDPAQTVKQGATENTTDKTQAVFEQFEALKKELEATKKAQAGSDQKVSELLTELKRKDQVKQTAEERIAALEAETQQAKAQAEKERWLNTAYKKAAEKGLPSWMVDNYGGDKDKLDDYLTNLKTREDELLKKKANELIAGSSHKPGSGNEQQVDVSKMSSAERLAYYTAEAGKRLGYGKQ